MKRFAVVLYCVIPLCIFAQEKEKQDDPFALLKFFIGKWEGKSNGEAGEGKVKREYKLMYDGKYIEATNKSTYKPQEKNPKGEVHKDLGFFSYDRSRKNLVLRQFHSEGFVNQYVQDSISNNGRFIRFTSEAIENIAPGWRARETYRILGEDEFEEVFELAGPGKEFEVYSSSRLKRK